VVVPVETLVSVFFVGPGKCGTSWVFDACRAHPALNAGLIKEPGEFLKRDVDLDAYHKLWRGPGVRCDFSNTYFFSDAAAEGVLRYNPLAKICITVRNPLSRLVSQYMFMCRNGRFSGPIDEAIAAHPEIVDRCRYDKHARRWLKRFAPEQLLVLRLETLQSDPVRYRTGLFDFLRVSDSAEVTDAMDTRQQAATPRSRLLARGTKELAELARKARLFRVIEWVKQSPLVDVLYRPLPKSYQQAHLQAIPDAVQKELEEEYSTFFSTISRHCNVRVV
jgi:hypothetical protein